MTAIYTPSGRAREYSPKALNIYLGCSHGCTYCYAPHAIQKSKEDYYCAPAPRSTVIKDLRMQLARQHIDEQVLLSFVGDPYTRSTDDNRETRRALELLLENHVPVAILTKSGPGCLVDIDLFREFGRSIMVGATLTFMDDGLSRQWEPGAALPSQRLEALRILKENGIKTFASFEPVIDPAQSLAVMRRSIELDCIDLYKIGKLNGMPAIERTIDWTAFLRQALEIVRDAGKEVYVKEDLRRAAPSVMLTPEETDADLHTVKWAKKAPATLDTFLRRTPPRPSQTSSILNALKYPLLTCFHHLQRRVNRGNDTGEWRPWPRRTSVSKTIISTDCPVTADRWCSMRTVSGWSSSWLA